MPFNESAYATSSKDLKSKFFIVKNKDPNIAYNKAWDLCEAKFGAGKCSGSARKPVYSGFAKNGKNYQELGF